MYTIFKTHTHLDIRAITMFGLSAKPNSTSPIGYFGTGLKMAIATLLRHSIPVRLFINGTEYEFLCGEGKFREQTYSTITMRKRFGLLKNWSSEELPFTLNLARNWELWMAFRELYANTLDEGGTVSEFMQLYSPLGEPDETVIIVGPSEEFAKIYEERDTIFLPEAKQKPDIETAFFQVFHKPSNYVYYRGMRVVKLDKPSIMTYNVLSTQQLTEDRTLKDQWWLPYQLVEYISQSTDAKLIHHFLNASDAHWESTWPFDYAKTPSATFLELVERRRRLHTNAPALRISTVHTPLYQSPRFSTMLKAQQPKNPAEMGLLRRFGDWVALHSAEFPDDKSLFQEVLDVLNKHEQEEVPF